MATTTNYGWNTPDDSALVKDGASAIRTLGSSIDTTVFANASAGIAKTIVDAKGDLIAATAADTVTRLAVGTNGQVLTADSAEATGVKWATSASGSQTVLATGSLSSTSVSITSIDQNYKDLRLYIYDMSNSSTAGYNFRFTINSNTSAIYAYNFSRASGALSNSGGNNVGLSNPINPNVESKMVLDLVDYTNTVASKIGNYVAYFNDYYSTPQRMFGMWAAETTSAISSIQLEVAGGTFSGTYTLIGIK